MDLMKHSGTRKRFRPKKTCKMLESKTENEEQSTSAKNLVAVKKMKVVDYLITSLFPSTSSVSHQGIIRIGNTFFLLNGGLLIPKDQILYGKGINRGTQFLPSYQWSTVPPHPQQLPVRHMVPYVSEAIGPAREIKTELAAFDIYVTEKMLQTILTHTNDEMNIAQYYILPKPRCVYPLSITELKAFIGILFLSAMKKDNKLPPSFLWGVCGSDIYSAVMSEERFEYLAQCLRFDEYSTRNIRENLDSFSHIREIWDNFITKCSEVFRPSMNCTIDEIFVDFNGNCRFKLPLPRQPQKHGIQIILLSDSKNRYIISGIPYLDKNNNGQMPLAEYMVEKLTRPVRGTHINITYANDMFTSIPLARRMLKLYKLTTIGTFHKNHIEIPPDMISPESRPVGSFISVYNTEDELQLCTYCSKLGEVDVILSSKHFASMTKEPERKPKVIHYYNSTKRGVDAIKKMCCSYSCSRPTKHWYLAIFYTILDLAAINSFTILNLNRARWGKPQIRQVDFLYKLALDLMLPHMKERLTDPDISDSIKNKIRSIMAERLKLNIELNPRKYTLKQIEAMYPPIEPDKSIANKAQRPTKMTVQQIQDLYPPIVSSIPVKSVVAELNTRDKSAKLSIRQIQDKYPPIYGYTLFEPVMPFLRQNSATLSIQQIQEMYPPVPYNISTKSNVLGLNVNWNHIQALYPPVQTVKSTYSVAPNMYTVQQTQQFFPPIQPTFTSYQDFWSNFKNILMQQIQAFYALMQPTISMPIQTVTSQNFTMNVLQRSTSLAETISPAPSGKPFSDIKPELCACGVCNYVGDKNNFVRCAKCAVVVCTVHRQLLCTNCFYNQPVAPNLWTAVSIKDECGICHVSLQDFLLYTPKCYKCAQLLCLQHSHMLCCFCVNV